MLPTSLPTYPQLGPSMVGAGLAIVLVAQLVPGIPIASAILLIGWGAAGWLTTTRSAASGLPWVVVNSMVYLMLGNLTLAAQLHAASKYESLLLRVDLLLAVLLGSGLFVQMLRGLPGTGGRG